MSDNLLKVTASVYSEYSVIIQRDSGETAEHSESWRHNVVNVTSLQAIAMSLQAGRVQTVGLLLVHRSALRQHR